MAFVMLSRRYRKLFSLGIVAVGAVNGLDAAWVSATWAQTAITGGTGAALVVFGLLDLRMQVHTEERLDEVVEYLATPERARTIGLLAPRHEAALARAGRLATHFGLHGGGQDLSARCLLCDYVIRGTLAEVRAKAEEHLLAAHPELA